MSELEGFELFRPNADKPLYIAARQKSVAICAEAYKALGCPQYVNVFTDDFKKRIMIKKAEKGYENAIKVVQHSAGRNMCLCYKKLADMVIEMFGQSTRVYGHVVGDGMMIFDKTEEKSWQEMN